MHRERFAIAPLGSVASSTVAEVLSRDVAHLILAADSFVIPTGLTFPSSVETEVFSKVDADVLKQAFAGLMTLFVETAKQDSDAATLS